MSATPFCLVPSVCAGKRFEPVDPPGVDGSERETAVAATVGDFIEIMESFAPVALAEEWDNAGLQVGHRDWRVKTVWVALDPLAPVVEAACRNHVDLLITHHPLIFRPLKSVDFAEPAGRNILQAAQNRLAVFAAHTNFDSVTGGLNDIFAGRLGLTNLAPLVAARSADLHKLVVFVPAAHEQRLLAALFESPAGEIGAYRCCSFRTPGRGTFKPGQDADPFSGEHGRVNDVAEVKIETVVRQRDLSGVIAHLRSHHPYETMAYDVYPLSQPETTVGIGRVGDLTDSSDLRTLALQVKRGFGVDALRVVGDPRMPVKRVAVCTGSGASLVQGFLKSTAEVFISGDLRYHDARDAEAARRGLIDIGHFASEHIFVSALTERLQEYAVAAGFDTSITACGLEKEPFIHF
ncbi:MAG: Nif3-like dinuclear metal center hexameric protein [Desulfobacterales bacterium]